MEKIKDAVNFNSITGIIWIAASLFYVAAGNIVLGMLHICIGCMWIAMSRKDAEEKKPDDKVDKTKKEGK